MQARLPPLLRERDFALFWVANVVRILPLQMIAVAVGWQVYAIHHDPLDIGWVGLAEFIPLPLLALPTGQLADRVSRRFVVILSLIVAIADSVLLLVVTLSGAHQVWPFVVLAILSGTSVAMGTPSMRAMTPELLPPEDMPTGMALRTIATQTGIVLGPALGGLLFAIKPELVYIVATVFLAIALACTLLMRPHPRPATTGPIGIEHLLGGITFLQKSRIVSGAILLDLFAVLFGGAVALLPVFARDILHVGPAGLGILRSAPALGALAAGVMLTRRPIGGNAGARLLIAIGSFGVSMIVFGLSRSFLLSLVALAASGAADMFSMNIRSTTVALATPDGLRGRVNAVEMVFISASNQLGAFESGAAAALIGTVPAVVAGGAATIVVAALWTRLFPGLARLDRLEQLRPEVVT
jgi:MFS family permease